MGGRAVRMKRFGLGSKKQVGKIAPRYSEPLSESRNFERYFDFLFPVLPAFAVSPSRCPTGIGPMSGPMRFTDVSTIS